jgi:hypothetical protein
MPQCPGFQSFLSPNMLSHRLWQPPGFSNLSPLYSPCLPVSPLGKVSLLFLKPSFFLGWALLPCPLSGSSCLTAYRLAWRTCGAHGCFFTCLLATVPEILAHCHLLQSRKKAASAVGPSPVFGCSSIFGAVLDFLSFRLHFL